MIGASTVICGIERGAFAGEADFAGLGGKDRVLQHRLVQFEADLADVTALLVAEQVAGAADVEIVAGKLEAGAETVEIAENFQTLLRHFGQRLVGRRGQVSIGAQLRAPDPPAQLVKLRQTEAVGAVDDDGVGGGDIEAAFDDGGREQHVVLALVECAHPLLDFAGAHLAVGADGFHLGHGLAQPFLEIGHVGDAGDDDEALPAAMVLAQQRLAHHHIVPFHHIGAHREPVDRRRLDGGELAQAAHRHLQGARDRGGGEGQHVDIGAQLLELFLVGDAEVLLLVDHHQTEPLEAERFGEDRVGADDHVHGSVGKASLGGAGLFLGHQPGEPADVEREPGEALDEALVVLAGEQRGRRNQRDLLPGHSGNEGRAQRYLGLAEADIAADQPVHRLALAKIGQDLLDGAFLVVGFLPGKTLGELVVARLFGQQHRRLAQRTGGGGAQQFVGDLADPLLEPRLAPLPGFAAEPVERHAFILAAETREHVEVLDRDVELVAARIGQRDAIVRALAHRDRLQPFVAPDAVAHVDDQIAGSERAEFGKEGVGILAALLAADEPVAEYVLLGDQFDFGVGKAGFERQDEGGGDAFRRQPQCLLP